MSNELPFGKISPLIFKEVILPRLGRHLDSVLVGPKNGVDVGIVQIGNKVIATTTDPVFIVPNYGWSRAAWFAIHILVSDAVTSGLEPKYLTIDLNLPVSITRDALEEMWSVIHRECEDMGIAIISGHTARYEGTDFPMVGGATVIAEGNPDEYITPEMAQSGDKVLITKGAAIEATGLFAASFPDRIRKDFGEDFRKRAEEYFYQMSVVKEARLSVKIGVRDNGVTSLHDATECGVIGGLFEVAQASGHGMIIEKDKIPVPEEVGLICERYGMDPYTSISEGTLIITVRPHKSGELIKLLRDNSITVAEIGTVTDEKDIILKEGKKETHLKHPETDPFWSAFSRIMNEEKENVK
ncbi:MAG TPA: AIR synthase [Firmicutes bacterium]|nr:AIR synthase [Bacillota bacterium]